MKIKSGKEETWEKAKEVNSHDRYSNAIISFAVRWAELMEESVNDGDTIAACAEVHCHDADTEGITGFMYGAAVSILAQLWEHGDELRKWHNGLYGMSEVTDGVVNPALMTISNRVDSQ